MTGARPARTRARALEATDSLNPGAFSLADWGLFVTIALIWGSSFLFIAIALDSIEPGLITWGRIGLGAAVLNVVPRARLRLDPEDRFRMVLLSLLWVGIPFTLFPLAEQHISSAVTGMLNGAMPIFAAIVAGVLLRTPPGPTQTAGLVVGLGGTLAVSLEQLGEGENAWLGVLMALAATVCYGFAINIAAPLQRRYGSLAVMARMLALATVWTLPFGLWSVPGSSWQLAPALSVAFIGAVGTGVAFVIMATLVGSVGSTRASMATYLIPVVAMVLGVVVRDEHVGWIAVVGVVLVVVGAWLASRPERTHAPTAVPEPTEAPVTLDALAEEVHLLAAVVDAPAAMLPTLGHSEQSGRPHLEVDPDETMHRVVCERGSEQERLTTTDADELLYWVFRAVTHELASGHELANRRPDEDSRRQLFEHQLHLLGRLDPEWRARRIVELGHVLDDAGVELD